MLPLREDGTPVRTLCEVCQNAVPNKIDRGCEWSISFQPVPNWNAVLRKLTMGGKRVDSYAVHECPRYIPDAPRNILV